MQNLLETVRFEQGRFHLIDLHQERFDRSRRELYGETAPIRLASAIETPQGIDPAKVYKVRITFSEKIESAEWIEYAPASVRSLKLVCADDIDYHLKYADRSAITKLSLQAEGADSIIIVKNGCITDSAYANLLFRENDRWITPNTPLLRGVMREYLLRRNGITEEPITPDDLHRFSAVTLINAMIPLERSLPIPIENVRT